MNRISITKPLASIVILLHVMTYCMPSANAAPGTLADAPLFLSTSVTPNIFILADDSGSMDWDLMTPESDGVIYLSGYVYYYAMPGPDNSFYWTVASEDYLLSQGVAAPALGVWRARNSSYNKLYYNPEITYTPWQGVDINGNPFANSDPTAARYNPYDPSVGTLNLTTTLSYSTDYPTLGSITVTNYYPARYYTWTDTNSNGVVDASDAHVRVEIRSTVPTYTGGPNRTDCAAAPTCTYAEEIQNFANWYSYYRKRNLSAKNAISAVIAPQTSRMGYATINNNNSVNTPIAAMNTDPTTGNKRTLLDKVFKTYPWNGTPLRSNLKLVGQYFESGTSAGTLFTNAQASPILSAANGGACQLNFDILMTDGFYNGGSPGVGNTDGDGNTAYDGSPYGDTYSNTLADVAMHYYERDLRTDLADDVPTVPGVDNATFQHLVTYTMAFGVTGTLDPATADPSAAGFSWPDPSSGNAQKIDDLWHAAYDGRGNFFSAENPAQLTTALQDTLQSITNRTSSASAVAFNSTNLGTDSYVYQARFDTAQWSGDLLSYALDPNNGSVAANPTWQAATVLDARNLAGNPRIILTTNSGTGVPFEWANLSTAEQADLKTNPSGGVDSNTIGQNRLNFLRGDRSNEGAGNLRIRGSRLGDIVHANPVYVGMPQLNYPDTAPFPSALGETYSDYKTNQAARQGIIYVGGNDGMLHGFNADTGEEVLGYVPSNLFSTSTTAGLHYLTDPNYFHRYYVDLSPTVSDVYIKTTPTGSPHWATVLVGGERAGGRGLFALDVSNPGSFSENTTSADNTVMWEFTSSDDPDLGYTFSQPTIAMTNVVDGNGNHRWAAIFGNGYNDTGSGQAQLFILFLDGGLNGNWTSAGDYVKITTGVGSSGNPNGLSSPNLIDLDGDGTVDRVYAGDLQGNMWAFDLSDTASTSNWGVAYKQGSTPKPLFTATDSSGTAQPITSKPTAVRHPTVASTTSPSNAPNLMVYFGTGQYLVTGDKTTTGTQTFYGVWDDGDKSLTRSNLIQQTFVSGFPSTVRVPTENTVDYSSKKGWYMDLPDSGERVVTNAKVRGNLVFFNTLIPSSEPCSFGGSGWLMSVKQVDGGPPDAPAVDINGDLVVDNSDQVTKSNGTVGNPAGHQFTQGIPAETNFLGDHAYTPGSSGQIEHDVIKLPDQGNVGRLSWREIRY